MSHDVDQLPPPLSARYRVLRRLGQGGFGVVVEAQDLELGRAVAIKRLRGTGADHDARERFLREARLTAKVRHPGFVEVFDFGVLDDGEAYIVYEFVPGSDLRQVTSGRRPTPEALAGWGAQLARALAAAHAEGVLHRDVKPENILRRPDGGVVLCDLGLAWSSGRTVHTAAGLILGTPAYLAPEVLRGQAHSSASDQFSLAATLAELATGQTVYGSSDHREVYRFLGKATRGLGVERLPPALSPLARSLDFDPGARFPDLGQLAEVLEGRAGDPAAGGTSRATRVLVPAPGAPRPPAPGGGGARAPRPSAPTPRAARRGVVSQGLARRGVASSLVALALLACGVAWVSRPGPGGPPTPTLEAQPEGPGGEASFVESLTEGVLALQRRVDAEAFRPTAAEVPDAALLAWIEAWTSTTLAALDAAPASAPQAGDPQLVDGLVRHAVDRLMVRLGDLQAAAEHEIDQLLDPRFQKAEYLQTVRAAERLLGQAQARVRVLADGLWDRAARPALREHLVRLETFLEGPRLGEAVRLLAGSMAEGNPDQRARNLNIVCAALGSRVTLPGPARAEACAAGKAAYLRQLGEVGSRPQRTAPDEDLQWISRAEAFEGPCGDQLWLPARKRLPAALDRLARLPVGWGPERTVDARRRWKMLDRIPEGRPEAWPVRTERALYWRGLWLEAMASEAGRVRRMFPEDPSEVQGEDPETFDAALGEVVERLRGRPERVRLAVLEQDWVDLLVAAHRLVRAVDLPEGPLAHRPPRSKLALGTVVRSLEVGLPALRRLEARGGPRWQRMEAALTGFMWRLDRGRAASPWSLAGALLGRFVAHPRWASWRGALFWGPSQDLETDLIDRIRPSLGEVFPPGVEASCRALEAQAVEYLMRAAVPAPREGRVLLELFAIGKLRRAWVAVAANAVVAGVGRCPVPEDPWRRRLLTRIGELFEGDPGPADHREEVCLAVQGLPPSRGGDERARLLETLRDSCQDHDGSR